MNIILYLNCHGTEIKRYFNKYYNKFNVIHVSTYSNINTYGINNIPKEIIEKFNEANILIYHPVSDKHGKWHFKNILEYCNCDTKKLMIPYYRFYGYFYEDSIIYNWPHICTYLSKTKETEIIEKFNLLNNLDDLNLIKRCAQYIINNIDNTRIDQQKEHLNKSLYLFKKLEVDSKIKMYDFLIKNYKKNKLFGNNNHPTEIFFYTLFGKIVNILNLEQVNIEPFTNTLINIWENEPIDKNTEIALELKFVNNEIRLHNLKSLTKEEYYCLHLLAKYKYPKIQNRREIYKIFTVNKKKKT